MTIQRMHHEIKLRLNKINSNHKQDLPTAFIDDFINDAQFRYIEIFYSGNNAKRFPIGFEVTQQRIDMLSTLVPPSTNFPVTNYDTDIYKFNFKDLNYPYLHFLRGSILTDCGKMELNIIKHDEFDDVLVDENRKPSLKWRRAIGIIQSDNDGNGVIYMYTNGEYEPNFINMSFIRKPSSVFYGGYDTLEFINGDPNAYNSTTQSINCELPEQYHSIVVDIAIELISRSIEDINQSKLTQDLISKTI